VWRLGAAYGEEDEQSLIERLDACRPSSLEAVTVPLGAARRWLTGKTASAIADVVSGDAEDDGDDDRRRRRDPHANTPVALRWEGDDSEWVTGDELRPGDVLVVDVTRGGLTAGSFDPDGTTPITDLGDIAQVRGRGVAALRLEEGALEAWSLPDDVRAALPKLMPEDTALDTKKRVQDWLSTLPMTLPSSFLGTAREWQAVTRAWASRRMRVMTGAGGLLSVNASLPRADVDPESADALTEDDDSSFRQVQVTLKDHSTDVRDFAARFTKSVGFDHKIAADVTLAAWLHDVGKADPRFQRWLVGGSEVRAAVLAEPLAKSALPSGNPRQRRQAKARAGYPTGYRHELLSLDMIKGQESVLGRAHDRDLVLHLVASHHGWCRPFAPPIDHADDFPVTLQHDGDVLAGVTRHRLARLDSGVADRFWGLLDRYGWWGLAWLEAVLRLADHRASEMEAAGAQ